MRHFRAIFLGLALAQAACSATHSTFSAPAFEIGTNTGNPNRPVVSPDILYAVCGVINRCNSGVTLDQCQNGFGATPGVNAPLGLGANYGTLNAVMQAEKAGQITGNVTSGSSCFDAINSLACSAPEVQTAYLASAPNPFAGAVNLVSSQACGSVFALSAQYSCSNKTFVRGANNAALSPVLSGSGQTYAISPALPAGLAMDPSSGVISGTPTALSAMTTYTVTAIGLSGLSTSQVSIRTVDGYIVNQTSDAHNLGPGCATSSGACTLRAAIEAIDASPSPNIVVLPPGVITLTLGSQLSIAQPVEIDGDCAHSTTIDGNATSRVFEVTAGPTTLSNLTIQNGSLADQEGAGIEIVASSENVSATLNNVVIQNNVITSGTNYPEGAGISVEGSSASAQATLNLNQCTVSGNIDHATGGHFGGGMSVWTNAQVTISNCSFIGNTAGGGGGAIANRGSNMSVSQSLFYSNASPSGEGGAIQYNSGASGVSSFVNVTFDSNSASMGGAIYNGGGGMQVNLINDTLVGNSSASTSYGGAIGGIGAGGATLENTILLANTSGGSAGSCAGAGGFAVTSLGHNLSDGSAPDCSLNSGLGDIASTAANLGPLQGNGGATQTMALLPGSAGISQGNMAVCPPTDQRGLPRTANGSCDIGAFEIQ